MPRSCAMCRSLEREEPTLRPTKFAEGSVSILSRRRGRLTERRTMFKPWWDLGMLAAESQQVIWLRSLTLAAGGSRASAEARRMVSEKLAVAAQTGLGVMLGDDTGRVVARYRKKVRANRRRLSR